MANQIICVLAETYGLRIYAIMLACHLVGSRSLIETQGKSTFTYNCIRKPSNMQIIHVFHSG